MTHPTDPGKTAAMGLNILFLQHPGTNSRDIFDDIIEGYREAGHNAFILDLTDIWGPRDALPTIEAKKEFIKEACADVRSTVAEHAIDLCVCMWANGPATFGAHGQKHFFEAIELPLLMHWLDAPQWAHGYEVLAVPDWMFNGPHSCHYINNPATAAEMAGVLGFANVITLPNAASPNTFRPHPVGEKDFDIVFGITGDHVRPTPVMLRELEKDEPDVQAIRIDEAASLRPGLIEIVRPVWDQRTDVEPFVDQALEIRLQCRDASILQQLSDLARRAPDLSKGILLLLQNRQAYVQFSLALRRIEAFERAFTFIYLSRYFRCATFGLSPSFTDWPGRWEHLGPQEYKEQAVAYSRGRLGLNVMRWQDDFGLNLKPFEITLSGAGLLQAYRVGIEEQFRDSECVVFHTPQECRRRVAELLADPPRLAQMAEAGRTRSLTEHCWKHRAHAVTRMIDVGRWKHAPTPTPADAATP